MYWIAFFSQTGTEIVNLSKVLKKSPDIIITNNNSIYAYEIYTLYSHKIHFLPKNPTPKDYLNLFSLLNIKHKIAIITLHGYLRILPKFFSTFSVYNLHPGLINKYPELKGLNPQARSINRQYPIIGCVIHKVICEVDSGEILLFSSSINTYNINTNYKVLKEMALQLWIKFFLLRLPSPNFILQPFTFTPDDKYSFLFNKFNV